MRSEIALAVSYHAIMVLCQAYGCSNRSGKSDKTSFHPIPDPEKHPELCGKWLAAIRLEKFRLKSYSYNRNNVICSEHFMASDFQEDMRARLMPGTRPRRMLKGDAVPSIFPFSIRTSSLKVRKNTEEKLSKAAARQKRPALQDRPSDLKTAEGGDAAVPSHDSSSSSSSSSRNSSGEMEAANSDTKPSRDELEQLVDNSAPADGSGESTTRVVLVVAKSGKVQVKSAVSSRDHTAVVCRDDQAVSGIDCTVSRDEPTESGNHHAVVKEEPEVSGDEQASGFTGDEQASLPVSVDPAHTCTDDEQAACDLLPLAMEVETAATTEESHEVLPLSTLEQNTSGGRGNVEQMSKPKRPRKRTARARNEVIVPKRQLTVDADVYVRWCSLARQLGVTPRNLAPILLDAAVACATIAGSSLEIHRDENNDVEIQCNENHNAEIQRDENHDVEIQCNEKHDVEIQRDENHSAEIQCDENHDVEIQRNDNHDAEIQCNENHNAEIQRDENHDVEIQCNENHDVEIQRDENHSAEIQRDENHDVEIQRNDNHDAEIQRDENHDVEIQRNENHDVEIQRNENYDAEIQRVENHDAEIQRDENHDADIQRNDNHDVESHADFVTVARVKIKEEPIDLESRP